MTVGVARLLVDLAGGYRWVIAVLLVLGVLSSLVEGVGVSLFIPLLQGLGQETLPTDSGSWLVDSLARLFSDVTAGRRVSVIAASVFALVLARAVLSYSNANLFHWLEARVGHRLRSGIFAQLLAVEYGHIERSQGGRLLHTLSTETWRTTEALDVLLRMLIMASTMVVYALLLLLISWPLTLIAVASMGVISLVLRSVGRRARRLGEEANEANAMLAVRMLEGVEGMEVIRAFGRERYEQSRFDEISERVGEAFRRIGVVKAALGPVHQVLAVALLVLILLTSLQEPAGLPQALVFVFVLYRLQPLATGFEEGRAYLNGLAAGVTDVAGLLRRTRESRVPASGSTRFRQLRSGIVFDSVTFSYEPARGDALRDMSLVIPARATTALVGPSGAGKSTLIKLLLRFYDPQRGEIRVDEVPLSALDLATWRRRVSFVGQGVYLFHASALDNIRYGRPDASKAEVEAAARLADAHEFIGQLPDGYDTLLGDRGTRISGGQRQRIALARAIVRQPDLLILDEATNAVDALSEHVIQGTLEQLGSRCTILLIAHRLSTIEHADRILVLEGGRLVEEGRLGDLARTGGLFTRLYDLPAPRVARP